MKTNISPSVIEEFYTKDKNNVLFWLAKTERYSQDRVYSNCIRVGTSEEIARKISREIDHFADSRVKMSDIRPLIFALLQRYDHEAARRFKAGEIYVRTSAQTFDRFDRSKISSSIIKETGLDEKNSDLIAFETEKFLKTMNLEYVSSSLIREIVNVKLIEHGFEKERNLYTRIGMPVYDLTQLIEKGSKENANLQYNPESLPYDEIVLVRKNNSVKYEKIGKIVDDIIDNNVDKLIWNKNRRSEIVNGHFDVNIFSFDEKFKVKESPVKAFIRNKPDNIYKITFSHGKSVKITKNHNLFLMKGGDTVSLPLSDLRVGDRILAPRRLKISETIEFIDGFSNLIKNTNNEQRKQILVFGKPIDRLIEEKNIKSIDKFGINCLNLNTLAEIGFKPSVEELKDLSCRTLSSYETTFPIKLYYPLQGHVGSWLGLMLSEGHFGTTLFFSNTDHLLHDKFTECSKRIFGEMPLRTSKENNGCFNTIIASTSLAKIIPKIFDVLDESEEKQIPYYLMAADNSVIKDFIKAYHDGDGQKNRMRIITSNKNISDSFIFLYLRLGEMVNIYENEFDNPNWNNAYDIELTNGKSSLLTANALNIPVNVGQFSCGYEYMCADIVLDTICLLGNQVNQVSTNIHKFKRIGNYVTEKVLGRFIDSVKFILENNRTYNIIDMFGESEITYEQLVSILKLERNVVKEYTKRMINRNLMIKNGNNFKFTMATVENLKQIKRNMEKLKRIINSDFALVEIKQIEKMSFENTYDLSVDTPTENFIAGEGCVFVHNTIHKIMADEVSKEYTLLKILPREVADAHLLGQIHVHDLDYFFSRPFCFSHDVRFFLKKGFRPDGTGEHTSIASPAKKPEVAFLHAAKVLAASQTNCAGGQGFSYFNTYMAPAVVGCDEKRMKQLAQMFIYEMSQMYVARGGQSIHHDDFVWIKDDVISSVKIGEFIDSQINANKNKVAKKGDMEILKLRNKIKTISLNPESMKFEEHDITAVSRHKPASEKVFKINTRSGKNVRVTDFHSVYTIRNGIPTKVKATELKSGDFVLTPKNASFEILDTKINLIEKLKKNAPKELLDNIYVKTSKKKIPIKNFDGQVDETTKIGFGIKKHATRSLEMSAVLEIDEDIALLLGLFIGDGSAKKMNSKNVYIYLSIPSSENLDRKIEKFAKKVCFNNTTRVNSVDLRFGSSILKTVFIYALKTGRLCEERTIPPIIFSMPDKIVNAFLKGLYSSDGSAYIKNKSRTVGIEYSTVNEKLAHDLAFLLSSRGGIVPDISVRQPEVSEIKGIKVNNCQLQYRLMINSYEQKMKFANNIGFLQESKNKIIAEMLKTESFGIVSRQHHTRRLPRDIVYSSFRESGLWVPDNIRTCKNIYAWTVSEELEKMPLNDSYDAPAVLYRLLNSDIALDEITNITVVPAGEYVYDFEVAPGGKHIENFLGGFGSILVSNTVFSSIDLDMHVPDTLKDVPVIGLRGSNVKGTYGDYEDETQKLFNAFLDVYMKGDAQGKPFNFPKFEVQLSPKDLNNGGKYDAEMYKLSELAAKFGTPYYMIKQPYMPEFSCYQSIPGSEKILILRDGKLQNIEIGKYIDSIMNKDIIEKGKGLDGEVEIAKCSDMAISFDPKTLEIKKMKIEKVMRHKTVEKILKLTLDGNRMFSGTEKHKIPIVRDRKIIEIRMEDVKIGDYLIGVDSVPFKIKNDIFIDRKNKKVKIENFEVKKIETVQSDYVYDLVNVENYHNFLTSDGIFSSNCCAYLMPLDKSSDADDLVNGTVRGGSLQVVTLNLPQIAYESDKEEKKLFELIDKRIDIAKQVMVIRRDIIERNLRNGMLPFLNQPVDAKGTRYYEPSKQSYTIGMVGINEMCKYYTGSEMHETTDSWMFGLKIMKHMKDKIAQLREETGMNFALARTPAESTASRFALIDRKRFPTKAIYQGDPDSKSIYYTNSFHVRPNADSPLFKRMQIEGAFHPLTDGGAMSHIWLGDANPDPEAVMKLTKEIATKTAIQYTAFTKDLSICNSCGMTMGGINETCPSCKSKDVQIWSRITGYYQNINGWNKGKLQELKDRRRYGL